LVSSAIGPSELLYLIDFTEIRKLLQQNNLELTLVRQTMLEIFQGFEALDAEKLDINFAHTPDMIAFGTDWDEKFVGWDQYRDLHRVQFSSWKSFKFETRELEVRVNGETAWASDRPHLEIETKKGEHVKEDVRITAVLMKIDSFWRVVQWHVSVGLGKRLHEY
jgi:ketosteroid isomerase-like protein